MKSRQIWITVIGAVGLVVATLIGIIPQLLKSTNNSSSPPNQEPISLAAPFDASSYFYPSGWMGDGERGKRYIKLDTSFRGNPRQQDTDDTCIKVVYQPGNKGWAGIYWQYPDNNWGDQPGRKITGAARITFWASGEKGGEKVEFKAGGISAPKKRYKDSFEVSTGRIALGRTWKLYTMPLDGKDLSNVIGAFAWVATQAANPEGLVFYIDNIRYE